MNKDCLGALCALAMAAASPAAQAGTKATCPDEVRRFCVRLPVGAAPDCGGVRQGPLTDRCRAALAARQRARAAAAA